MDADIGMKRDLTGERFGKLTVIEPADKKGSKIYWRCKCDCGKETVVEHYHLTEGRTKSCGCLGRGRKAEDLTGKKFGRLTVIGPVSEKEEGSGRLWECKCDCGNISICSGDYLRKGTTRSCGCLAEEAHKDSLKTSIHIVDGTCIEKISCMTVSSNNKTGTRGITKTSSGKWKAAIGFQGRRYNLGTYANYDDAVAARKEAEENLYTPFLEKYKKEQNKSEICSASD